MLHQLGKCEKFGDHEVCNPFPLNHAVDLLIIVKIKMIDKGYAGTCHVQSVKCEHGFRQRRTDERHPRMIFPGDIEGGKRFRIPFPVAEHLPVCILPVSVLDGYALQTFLAAGIQLPDK